MSTAEKRFRDLAELTSLDDAHAMIKQMQESLKKINTNESLASWCESIRGWRHLPSLEDEANDYHALRAVLGAGWMLLALREKVAAETEV